MIKKITILTVSIYLLTSCEVRGRPEVAPIEGYLTTPEGKVKFKKLSSHSLTKRLRIINKKDKITYLQATTPNTAVVFTPMGTYSVRSLLIAQKNKPSEFIVKLNIEEAFYQVDGTEKKMALTQKK